MKKKYNYTKKTGRPSKFNTIDKNQFKKLVLAGWDDSQIADFFGIAVSTFIRWKNKNKEFCDALKDWKVEADKKVEKSLYQRAIGYSYDEVVYEKSNIGGLGMGIKRGEIENIKHVDTYKTKITVKQVIPDVTAQIFWLKNRQPDQWRDKTEHEHSGEIKLTPEEKNARRSRIGKMFSKLSTV